MSYKVLARKWRPQHFRDMIGQEPVLRALINALDTGRLHHAYLFTGMRGVGKTTIARIFAKCLNCIANGVSSSPCGECSACRDIEAGRFFDLIEVDAASRTKVDETRELLENVPYAPASGRYKVYLIDEVHMFSTHSFNALLKTLEEPPEHVKFLLATTDPQKVPLTVLSRCLQFNLRRMPTARLADYLETILDAEEIAHERPGLELIADAAEGSVRDSLSLVEQAAAFGEGAIREGEVASMLGRVSTARLVGLLEALGDGDLGELFARVDALAEYAPDFGQLLGELLSLLHRVALVQSVPDAVRAETGSAERIAALGARLAPDEVQLWYQIGLHARRDLPFAPDPREAFDMALLRMRAFAPAAGDGSVAAAPSAGASAPAATITADASASPAALAEDSVGAPSDNSSDVPSAAVPAAVRVAAADPLAVATDPPAIDAPAVAAALAAGSRTAAVPDAAAPDTAPSASAPVAVPVDAPSGVPTDDPRAAVLAAAGVAPAPARSAATAAPLAAASPDSREPSAPAAAERIAAPAESPAPALAPAPAAAEVPASGGATLTPAGWPAVIDAAGLSGMPRQLAAHCVLLSHEDGALVLELEAGAEHMNSPRFAERLRTALVAWAGAELSLDIRVVDQPLATPARLDAAREESALADARRSIDEDPLAQALVERVDGTLDTASVRALDPPSESQIDNHPGERT